jgi:hypothetical protein
MLYKHAGIGQIFGAGNDVFGKIRVTDFDGAFQGGTNVLSEVYLHDGLLAPCELYLTLGVAGV